MTQEKSEKLGLLASRWGNNRQKVSFKDKQPKGVKPASVHSVCSGTKRDKLAMAQMQKINCLLCAWRRLWYLPGGVQEEEKIREMRLLTQYETDCHQAQAVGPPTLKSGVDQQGWTGFVSKWEHYKKEVVVPGLCPATATRQGCKIDWKDRKISRALYLCLDEELKFKFKRTWPYTVPALQPECLLILMVKWLAWGQKTKSSYTPQAADFCLIVKRDNGVVTFDTRDRVVANTEDCHGGSKNSTTGFNANQPNQLLGTAINEAEVGHEMVDTGLDMTTGVVVQNSGVVTKPEDCLGCKNVFFIWKASLI